jgi:hypothetical protein
MPRLVCIQIVDKTCKSAAFGCVYKSENIRCKLSKSFIYQLMHNRVALKEF